MARVLRSHEFRSMKHLFIFLIVFLAGTNLAQALNSKYFDLHEGYNQWNGANTTQVITINIYDCDTFERWYHYRFGKGSFYFWIDVESPTCVYIAVKTRGKGGWRIRKTY